MILACENKTVEQSNVKMDLGDIHATLFAGAVYGKQISFPNAFAL